LTGLIGFQTIGLEKLLKPGSLTSNIGPAIHLPIFDGGRLRANYAVKSAGLDAAIAQYNQSIVSAAQEVAEQLTRIASLTAEEQETRNSVEASKEAHRLAMLRYRGGLSSYLPVLAAEIRWLFQQRATVELKAKRYGFQVALISALGGGFVEPSRFTAADSAATSKNTSPPFTMAVKPQSEQAEQ
jgi:outer membrane protein TolC